MTGQAPELGGHLPVTLLASMRTIRLLIVASTLALVVAACTSGSGPVANGVPATTRPSAPPSTPPDSNGQQGQSEPTEEGGVTVEGTTPSPEPTPGEKTLLAGLPGRLAIGAANRLSITDPDGTQVRVLNDDANVAAAQPVWSPDGSSLAWSRATAGGHELVFTTVQSEAEAEVEGESESGVEGGVELVSPAEGPAAFYLQWSAAGDRLAYLRTDPGGRGVELGTAAPGDPASTLLATAPVYMSWSPFTTELVAHVTGRQVIRMFEDLIVGAEQAEQTPAQVLLQPSGTFTTPAWIDAKTIMIATPEGLVMLDVDSGRTAPLLEAEEEVRFVVSPDRRRVAYHLPELSDTASSTVALAQGGGPPVGGLAVLDLNSGESIQVSPSDPLSFEWSPDSSRLAWLEDGGAPGQAVWSFWDGATLTVSEAEPYLVSDRDRGGVLPFFEQYAQSHSRWSPDGRAFAFAGILDGQPDGVASGIWVHLVDTTTPSVRLVDGDFVTWSG